MAGSRDGGLQMCRLGVFVLGCAALQTVEGIPDLPGTFALPWPGCKGSCVSYLQRYSPGLLQKVKGVPRVWKVKAELREQHDLPEELPEELVSLTLPCRLCHHSSATTKLQTGLRSVTVAEDQFSPDWPCWGLTTAVCWKPGQGVQGADDLYQIFPGAN